MSGTAAALLWAAEASDIEVQLMLGHAEIETGLSSLRRERDGGPARVPGTVGRSLRKILASKI
jgi:hypothetical protein